MSTKLPLDPYADILGVDFSEKRLSENLQAFEHIAAEIRKLRSLDLTDVHPPIVFDATAVYRSARGDPSSVNGRLTPSSKRRG